MGVAKDSTRPQEDVLSTPLPGETVAMFYNRSREWPSGDVYLWHSYKGLGEYWAQKILENGGSRGKMLRRDAFGKARERYSQSQSAKIVAYTNTDPASRRRIQASSQGSRTHPFRGRLGQRRDAEECCRLWACWIIRTKPQSAVILERLRERSQTSCIQTKDSTHAAAPLPHYKYGTISPRWAPRHVL